MSLKVKQRRIAWIVLQKIAHERYGLRGVTHLRVLVHDVLNEPDVGRIRCGQRAEHFEPLCRVISGAIDLRKISQRRYVAGIARTNTLGDRCRRHAEGGAISPRLAPSPVLRVSIGRQREHLEDALGAGQGALHRLPLVAERRDRLEEALEEQDEGGQRPERDLPGREDPARPGPEQQRRRE